ncbi:uncharacterized protein [Oryza sativa Japonica Group]|uniref:uncharacterized protein isoform X3 n=1 Tax=Oryza sativa subsp. japonica TaxID=39947 RepID=UPI0007755A8E|nr:uncharacterized protein LOC4325426 isoform X3 [Oryza sativa Japonica Group]
MMRLGRAPCCYCFTEPHPAGGVAAAVRLRLLPPARAANTSSEPAARLRAVLEQVDEELRKGNDEAALSLVRGSQGADGGLRFFGAARQVYFGGGVRNLILDTIGHNLSQKYRNRVIQHEAGHFLIAYLLGVLPKGYTITSLDTFIKKGSLNVQAGTAFVDFEFLQEVNSGKLSATMLNKFSCIALAGVATEYLLYGYAEGGLADIGQLDGLLKGLGFTQKKADSQVRWAVLNTVPALRRHKKARSQLAEAMSSGKSVGSCIGVIEENINSEDI